MDFLEKLCTLWLLATLKCGWLMAQFSTDLLYKEVNFTFQASRFKNESGLKLTEH